MTHNWPEDTGPGDEDDEARERTNRGWVAFGSAVLIFWVAVIFFLLKVSGKL